MFQLKMTMEPMWWMSGTQQRFVIHLCRNCVTNIRYVWDPAETTVMRKVLQSGTYPTGETNNAALATIVNMGMILIVISIAQLRRPKI